MPLEILSDFSPSWCTALLQDPNLRAITTASRVSHPSTGENSLLATTLANSPCIRAVKTFLRNSSNNTSQAQTPEVYMLFSLGRGVDGIAGTCHGAIIALMLDEVMGALAAEVFGRYNIVTTRLDVGFHKRLDTPRVVLTRAILEGADRNNAVGEGARRVKIIGTVEDGENGVFATGKSEFAKLKERL